MGGRRYLCCVFFFIERKPDEIRCKTDFAFVSTVAHLFRVLSFNFRV